MVGNLIRILKSEVMTECLSVSSKPLLSSIYQLPAVDVVFTRIKPTLLKIQLSISKNILEMKGNHKNGGLNYLEARYE